MKSGFTLIELLVAIAVFFILTSFVVVKYQGNEDLRYLRNDVQALVDDLQKVQNMALTGESVGGYSPDSYRLVINDCTSDCGYEIFANGQDTPLISKKLAHSVVSAVKGDSVVISNAQISVVFRLPRGRMFIYNNYNFDAPDDNIGLDTLAVNISNDDEKNNFCLQLNSISGRIGMLPGKCE